MRREGRMRRTLSLVSAAVPAVLLVLFLRVFVVGLYVVPSASMDPTIEVGDLLLAEKAGIALGTPAVGEVVTLESPESPGTTLVKRVVAVGGQTVDVRAGRLWVDGEPLDEPYAIGRTAAVPESGVAYPHVVAEGCVWVMGDNREASRDSRVFGDVPASSVSSYILLTYWPLDRLGLVR